MEQHSALDSLLRSVSASSKYRQVCPQLILRLGAEELKKRRSPSAAAAAVRKKLHQIGAAFFPGQPKYGAWTRLLRSAAARGPADALSDACLETMKGHASTLERLPFVQDFYRKILAQVPKPCVIADLGCGLNPLALPLIGLWGDVQYCASDIYQDLTSFLNDFFQIARINGRAEARDALCDAEKVKADLALLLKLLPTLEQIKRGSGLNLIEQIQAKHVVVSFPARSLGGREKGMVENYGSRFQEAAAARSWRISSLSFPSEIVFIVDKG